MLKESTKSTKADDKPLINGPTPPKKPIKPHIPKKENEVSKKSDAAKKQRPDNEVATGKPAVAAGTALDKHITTRSASQKPVVGTKPVEVKSASDSKPKDIISEIN